MSARELRVIDRRKILRLALALALAGPLLPFDRAHADKGGGDGGGGGGGSGGGGGGNSGSGSDNSGSGSSNSGSGSSNSGSSNSGSGSSNSGSGSSNSGRGGGGDDHRYGGGGGSRRGRGDGDRSANRGGGNGPKSPRDVMSQVTRAVPGQIVGVRTQTTFVGVTHDFKVIDKQGRVVSVRVDGYTGEVTNVSGR